jgi:nucleotide-binding universal stress UspA family protein
MESIVVGVDGSARSLEAVDLAAALVRDLPEAELVAVHSNYVPYFVPGHVDGEIDLFGIEAHTREISDGVKTRLDGTDTPWRFERREGEPAEELTTIASELGARLLVVGRSGMGTLRDLIVGSVSNRLVHHMDVPVLLV